jgi:hypothetical protein
MRKSNSQKAIEKYTNRPRDIWERFGGESAQAFQAFSIYLAFGIGNRSMEKVRVELGKKTGYIRQLEKWSSKFSWVTRSQAYDSNLLEDMLKSNEVERQKMYKCASTQAMTLREFSYNRLYEKLKQEAPDFTVDQLIKMFEMGLRAEMLTREGLLSSVTESGTKFEFEVQTKTSIYELVKDDPESKHYLTRVIDRLAARRQETTRTSVRKPRVVYGSGEQ